MESDTEITIESTPRRDPDPDPGLNVLEVVDTLDFKEMGIDVETGDIGSGEYLDIDGILNTFPTLANK
ncbi:MAG: hypothetical protein M1838_005706 [Thelocarpon superellum]|nr:MAG: hypothetical protein M1838_005706 [Thelocarpon superellum]